MIVMIKKIAYKHKTNPESEIHMTESRKVIARACSFCGSDNILFDGIIVMCRNCGIHSEPIYWKDYQYYLTWDKVVDE